MRDGSGASGNRVSRPHLDARATRLDRLGQIAERGTGHLWQGRCVYGRCGGVR